MRTFNKLYGISLLSILLSVAACTSETEERHDKPLPDPEGGGTARREVLLTLKNKLSVIQTKAGDVIATADENKISSLDIYVFGSTTENGTYSYQERFCYREKAADMPVGNDVTALDLTAKDADGKETTALLSLKKGLFVKLYCIANQPKLLDVNDNTVTNFIALQQSNPGQTGNIVTEGTPLESAFLTYHSSLLSAWEEGDILLTPLPMTGAYTTPLDLTDFSVSARLQLGFKLTRAVARFDIVNDAALSKFTIQSVSMANGRRGVSFFPLNVYGSQPATDGELITYPARKFEGDKANEGNCIGAFYTWPSPMGDGGYLILSGTYATNLTDPVPVTYKVFFKPEDNGNYIEVSQNHRYTVNITKADEYHLDFTINVEDWTDEGNIDDYEPGGDVDAAGMNINITGDNGSYDPDTRMVTMSITNDAQFTIEGGSTSGYYTRMYYENDDTENQWLTMNPKADYMPTKTEAVPITYTISKNNEYTGTKFPVAFIRFTDKISAKETVVIVQPIASPVVKEKTISNGSTIDVDAGEIMLYQSLSVASPTVTFSVFASGGSQLEFPDGDTPGSWLKISPATEQDLSQSNYTLTLNTASADFPDPFPLAGKTINVVNKGDNTKKTTLTLKLKSDITVTSAIAGNAEFETSGGILRLYNNSNDKVTLTVNTISGSDIKDLPNWVSVSKSTDKNEMTYTFTGNNIGSNCKFTIYNKADNLISKTYTVYSISTDVTFSGPRVNSSYTTVNNFTSTTSSVTYFPCNGSYVEFDVESSKGIALSNGDWSKLSLVSENTLASGRKSSKVRLVVGNGYSDGSFATIKGNTVTLKVNDVYSNSTKKIFTVSQYATGIVYPGSDKPANLINNARCNVWVAPVNAANNVSYSNIGSISCPSGWRIPYVSDFENIQNANFIAPANTLYKDNPKVIVAFPIGLYWSSNAGELGIGLHVPSSGTEYGVWTLGVGNRCSIRCIRNK